jgi:peptide/nickel transport system substrate-binding protein
MPARIARRRFLWLAASAAATGAVMACQQAPRVATKPTEAPAAAGKPADTGAKPAAEAPKPAAPTQAPLIPATPTPLAVSQSIATPVAQAAAGKFKEAPELAQLVKDGKLPAVDQRLPQNPRVIKPLEETGQYGGVWHRAWRGLADRLAIGKLMEERLIEFDAPDPDTIRVVANSIEKWDQNPNATEYTFFLRKGLKWSDGVELTTDDVTFWWEDVQLNKDLRPQPSLHIFQLVEGKRVDAKLQVIDKHTFKVTYAVPNALLPLRLANSSQQGTGFELMPAFVAPSHYLKKIHQKYAKKEDLDKLMADKKVGTWVELWGKGGAVDGPLGHYVLNVDLPTIAPWKLEKAPPADPVRFVRNPYYWQVDEQGNQLPYIDAIEHALFENNEVLKLWVAQGKIDCQNRSIDVGSYTFFKENEAKGGYRVLHWRSASTTAFFPNMTAPDPVLREIFAKPEFREALNIAVNRKEISEVIFNGLQKPRQYSPIKGSPDYDPEMETRWTEYNPTKANELLDKIGLKKGADGVRMRPDGKPLELTVEHQDAPGGSANDTNELIRKYWTAVGVKTSIKAVDRALYEEHVRAGEIEVGKWGWDRASVNQAAPGRWLATINDGPWAPLWGHWYEQQAWKKEEPPKDHWIRKIWDLWEKTQQEPDAAKRNAHFRGIIDIHKQAPVAIGVVGESVAPWIVKNNFRNIKAGYINDDVIRDYGLVNPQQFFFKK